MTLKLKSSGCGQNKTFEENFSQLSDITDKTTDQLMRKMNNRIIVAKKKNH